VVAGAPLARYSTFKIGGPAEWLVEAGSLAALRRLLAWVHRSGRPIHLLGLGSNVLFPDEGMAGVVVRLVGELRRLRFRGEWVSAGGGVPLPHVARRSAQRGLVGLEALSGFPSTVGGGVVMNAGCYGTEIKDVLVDATLVDPDGTRRRLGVEGLRAAYRSTALQGSGVIVTRALFRLRRGDAAAAMARIDELNRKRWASLPSGLGNAGSIFKNPPGDHAGRLIEAVGLKGKIAGRAQISPKHANVIVNLGGARAADVLELMAAARRGVEGRFGVRLEPEVVLAGSLRERYSSA
jgi:UDP-N-acetylmuramate dehydrogenase